MTMRRRTLRLAQLLLAILAGLVFFTAESARAASITNFATRQDGTSVVMTYDVAADAQKIHVGLLLRLGERLLDPRALRLGGDLGLIAPGKGKRIVWEAGKDFPAGLAGAVDGELVAVDIVEEPFSGLSFARLGGGCFEMGCGPWSPACDSDEQPVFAACPGPFALALAPVGTKAFAAFLNDTGRAGNFTGLAQTDGKYAPLPGQEAAPVGGISREDAQSYADWLSGKTGKRFALPDETEWEYACRGGGRLFAFGSPDGRMPGQLESPISVSSGVNILGLVNMSGGIWEWTRSAYAPYPLTNDGAGGTGVLRGGRLGSSQRNARCMNRYEREPQAREASSGFRLVMLP